MKNWKKVVLLLMPILALTVLAGCSFGGDTASKNAKDDAQGVLDFVYKGDTASNFSDISTMSASDSKQYILDTWAQTQYDYFKSQGAPSDDFSFKLGDTTFDSKEIVTDAVTARLQATRTISDYQITSVTINGNEAKITAKIKPIASLSEQHPLTTALSDMVDGNLTEYDNFIKSSDEGKAFDRIVMLKLYAIYYGDHNKVPDKTKDYKTIEFTLKNSGNHFQADKDVYNYLMQQSRADEYSDGTGGSSSSSSSSN